MRRKGFAGFTLVEVLIGTIIFAIIISAAFMLIIRWNQISTRNEALTEAVTAGRQAINLISKDIEGAYYIYDYATVYIGDQTPITTTIAGNLAANIGGGLADEALSGGVDQGTVIGGGGSFFTPAVTWTDPQASDLPSGYPFTGGNEGLGGLQTDVLTMVATSMVEPIYVCYFRFPGPADGFRDTSEASLWDHLVRLTMTCTSQPAGSQGAWYSDSVPWNDPNMAYSAGATSSVHFEGALKTWDGTDTCYAANAQVLCPVENDASGGVAIFTVTSPHPYSDTIPMSPFMVHVDLQAGDPNSNVLLTGGSASNHSFASLQMDVYARNVTLPESQ